MSSHTLVISTRSFVQRTESPEDNLHVPPHGPSFKGKHAPNFVLYDFSGKSISLMDYAGKPVVVNFWATWCPPCLREMPWFEEVYRKNGGSSLIILGLSTDLEGESVPPEKVARTAKHMA